MKHWQPGRVVATALLGYFAVGISLVGTAQTVGIGQQLGKVKRPVSVGDAIEMTQNGDRRQVADYFARGDVARFSPDRRRFLFVTEKANLRDDTIEFSLLLFKSADAFNFPAPDTLVTMASSSNRAAISNVTWLADNESIMFLGERPGETPQIYKINSRTRKLEKLTSHPTQVVAFAANKKGDRFVFVAKAKLPAVISEDMLRKGFVVTSQSWTDLYVNRPPSLDSRRELFVKTSSMGVPQRVGGILDLYQDADFINLQVSPNGKYALLRAAVLTPPEYWREYGTNLFAPRAMRTCKTGEAWPCPFQYLLVDLDKGTIDPLLDAPIIVAQNFTSFGLAEWTRSSSLLLVNVLLPLEGVNPEERRKRQTSVYIAEVTTPDRQIVKIEERQLPHPAFYIQHYDNPDRIVTLPLQASDGPCLEFRYERGRWNIAEIAPHAVEPADRLTVTLEQDMNTPPTLVATDPGTRRKSLLLDLNPQFAGLTFGRVEQFNWKGKDGHDMSGLLYYPPDYIAGKRYPLVIQTHGFSRDRFWIVGPYTTGFAAQPLANKGFLVLQLDDVPGKEVNEVFGTPREGPHETAAYEAAIDALYDKGLIDRSRVGISGFSRTAYHVLYALSHSQYHFGAAVVSDGVNFGYAGCVFYFGPLVQPLCEKMNGGSPPYGDGLSLWVASAPTFNLNRIHAPTLLEAILGPLGEWEIYSGLRWLKKPVELLNFYPEGEHSLIRPQQRLLSEGSVVDWYCFWLKDEEDPDPAKSEQYARWRALREQDKTTRPARTAN